MTGFIWLYNFRVYLEDYYPDLNKHDLKKINMESGTLHTKKGQEIVSEVNLCCILYLPPAAAL